MGPTGPHEGSVAVFQLTGAPTSSPVGLGGQLRVRRPTARVGCVARGGGCGGGGGGRVGGGHVGGRDVEEDMEEEVEMVVEKGGVKDEEEEVDVVVEEEEVAQATRQTAGGLVGIWALWVTGIGDEGVSMGTVEYSVCPSHGATPDGGPSGGGCLFRDEVAIEVARPSALPVWDVGHEPVIPGAPVGGTAGNTSGESSDGPSESVDPPHAWPRALEEVASGTWGQCSHALSPGFHCSTCARASLRRSFAF
ncbi:unnamed protein product [Lampetra planeri]